MASKQLPAILVARFLKANHFPQTLETFLAEAGLSIDDSETGSNDWTLEKLIKEKTQFDAGNSFERTDAVDDVGWSIPYPSKAITPAVPIGSNVLSINCNLSGTSFAVTTASNECSLVGTAPPYECNGQGLITADSPILSTAFLSNDLLVASTMSGKIALFSTQNGHLQSERRDHSKWVVKVVSWMLDSADEVFILATAGWDQKVHLYYLHLDQTTWSEAQLEPPFHTIETQTNPEALVFVRNPDSGHLYLLVSQRDSSFLYYYRCEVEGDAISKGRGTNPTIKPAGRQNLAPHSNAWVAFSPSALAAHPRDPTLLAIATSHLPFQKVIIVRLLFPDSAVVDSMRGASPQETVAGQARADLALQDREDAAITLQVSTRAAQTPYSTPQICWRPDGKGVWTNGDDGVIRGVDVRSGKVIAHLTGHEPGSKVRTIWAGVVGAEPSSRQEVVISGAFDKKVFVWKIEDQVEHENQ